MTSQTLGNAPLVGGRIETARLDLSQIVDSGKVKVHGPFPGQVVPASASEADSTECTYLVRHRYGVESRVVANHVQVDLEGEVVFMWRGATMQYFAPLRSLNSIEMLTEDK